MIVTWRIALRIGALVLLAVVLQVSFFSYISLFGISPDVMPVVIAALGLLGGGVIGAVCGFLGGLLLDSALLQTLGVSSLVLLSVGFLAGRYREATTLVGRFAPAGVTATLTVFAAAAFAAIQVMLGVETKVSLVALREIIIQGLLGFILALGVLPFIHLILRASLVDEVQGSLLRSGLRMPKRLRLRRRRPARRRTRTVETRAA